MGLMRPSLPLLIYLFKKKILILLKNIHLEYLTANNTLQIAIKTTKNIMHLRAIGDF